MLASSRKKALKLQEKAQELVGKLEEIASDLQDLHDEETERFDGLPESKQNKELEDDHENYLFAIEETISKLESAAEEVSEALSELDTCRVE